MSTRISENTEQLSARARLLLNQQLKQQPADLKKDSLEKTSQEANCAGHMSVNGAKRRLREEWAELKAGDEESPLVGVLAHVCVRKDSLVVALKAALMDLGASVASKWSVLVTHLIWQPGADTTVRVDARLLNAHVVTPKWVMACAKSYQRVPEKDFRASSRRSDPLDPHALTRILKEAETHNISLGTNEENDTSLSSDSSRKMKLHLDVSSSQNTSLESSEQSPIKTGSSLDSNINTAPRKAHPAYKIMKRKLFTKRNGQSCSESEEEMDIKGRNPYTNDDKKKKRIRKKRDKQSKYTQKVKETAENNTAKCTKEKEFKSLSSQIKHSTVVVLTSMNRGKRKELISLIRDLPIRIQKCVSSQTTHVVCGDNVWQTWNALCGSVRGCWVVNEQWLYVCAAHRSVVSPLEYQIQELKKVSMRARIERAALQMRTYAMLIFSDMHIRVRETVRQHKEIIALLELCGAVIVYDAEDVDVTIVPPGELVQNKCVLSNWISDSIAAGKPRNIKLYLL